MQQGFILGISAPRESSGPNCNDMSRGLAGLAGLGGLGGHGGHRHWRGKQPQERLFGYTEAPIFHPSNIRAVIAKLEKSRLAE